MDEPAMPQPLGQQPAAEPKPFVRKLTDEHDGTPVDLEIHHNAVEL
jgi:hypothetical protein